jgi:hypothetical protein
MCHESRKGRSFPLSKISPAARHRAIPLRYARVSYTNSQPAMADPWGESAGGGWNGGNSVRARRGGGGEANTIRFEEKNISRRVFHTTLFGFPFRPHPVPPTPNKPHRKSLAPRARTHPSLTRHTYTYTQQQVNTTPRRGGGGGGGSFLAQSVEKMRIDNENVPLTALAGRSGRTPSKRATMGGPTMVPYKPRSPGSPLVRRDIHTAHLPPPPRMFPPLPQPNISSSRKTLKIKPLFIPSPPFQANRSNHDNAWDQHAPPASYGGPAYPGSLPSAPPSGMGPPPPVSKENQNRRQTMAPETMAAHKYDSRGGGGAGAAAGAAAGGGGGGGGRGGGGDPWGAGTSWTNESAAAQAQASKRRQSSFVGGTGSLAGGCTSTIESSAPIA